MRGKFCALTLVPVILLACQAEDAVPSTDDGGGMEGGTGMESRDGGGEVTSDGGRETDSGGGDGLCSTECPWHDNGQCDDGGEGSETGVCFLGTDCGECGPRDPADAPVHEPIRTAACSSEPAGRAIGDLAEDFTLLDQYGNEFTLSDHCGSHIYLAMGAMWCSSCRTTAREKIPTLVERFRDHGLVIVNVMSATNDGSPPDAEALAAWAGMYDLNSLDVPVLADPNWDVWVRYWPRHTTPREMLLDPDGRIIDMNYVHEYEIERVFGL